MDLLLGINKKNNRAYNQFFESFFSSLVVFTDKYMNCMDESADIAQECFVVLYTGEEKFDSLEKVKGFLYVLARNMALNRLKHSLVEDKYQQLQQLEATSDWHDGISEEEIYGMVYRAINQLAPQSRRVILLSLRGYSNGEVAEMLSISINSVRTLKQNAYKKLRILLKEYFIYLFLFDFFH